MLRESNNDLTEMNRELKKIIAGFKTSKTEDGNEYIIEAASVESDSADE